MAGSLGAWAACDVCHDIIERGDRSALTRHTVDSLPWIAGVTDPVRHAITEEIRAIHAEFFARRDGEAEPIV
ncbi:MAG TPA: hypothetical protein VLV48_02680 [Thermoanaerobaculia bacterium]|nr:hypothetical protein [Thermoanaerobaculia bacterium]